MPHNFIINIDHDGNDTWIATGHGLGWASGDGYYAGLQEKPQWLTDVENAKTPTPVQVADH